VPALGRKDYQLHFYSFKECTVVSKVGGATNKPPFCVYPWARIQPWAEGGGGGFYFRLLPMYIRKLMGVLCNPLRTGLTL
jgi:hypothetical protein